MELLTIETSNVIIINNKEYYIIVRYLIHILIIMVLTLTLN